MLNQHCAGEWWRRQLLVIVGRLGMAQGGCGEERKGIVLA